MCVRSGLTGNKKRDFHEEPPHDAVEGMKVFPPYGVSAVDSMLSSVVAPVRRCVLAGRARPSVRPSASENQSIKALES